MEPGSCTTQSRDPIVGCIGPASLWTAISGLPSVAISRGLPLIAPLCSSLPQHAVQVEPSSCFAEQGSFSGVPRPSADHLPWPIIPDLCQRFRPDSLSFSAAARSREFRRHLVFASLCHEEPRSGPSL